MLRVWLLLFSMSTFTSALQAQVNLSTNATSLPSLKESILLPVIAGESLHAPELVASLYTHSDTTLVWQRFTSTADQLDPLITLLQDTRKEGLCPEDYHLDALQKMSVQNGSYSNQQLVQLDLLLSDAFLLLISHLRNGKLGRICLDNDWQCANNQMNIPPFLALSIQEGLLAENLQTLAPPYQQYPLLKREMAKYLNLLQQFPDSLGITDTIGTIAANMERWRWLPRKKDSLHILVNIPAFELFVYQGDTQILSMKVIVGSLHHPTPIFNCEISSVVLHPNWNVPPSIARWEVLSEVKQNRRYLEDNHMVVRQSWGPTDTANISLDSVYWDSIQPSDFPHRFVQLPGPLNPLGNIKFMLPNQFNVYLHDTPVRQSFQKEVRAYSHGCIRLENPLELGYLLLQNDSILQLTVTDSLFGSNEEHTLDKPVPISINYWTVWIDSTGAPQFYEDIYQRDDALIQQLRPQKRTFPMRGKTNSSKRTYGNEPIKP